MPLFLTMALNAASAIWSPCFLMKTQKQNLTVDGKKNSYCFEISSLTFLIVVLLIVKNNILFVSNDGKAAAKTFNLFFNWLFQLIDDI